jgi:AraC-like DNA-binding protein
MPDIEQLKEKARSLRMQNFSLSKIATQIGMSQSFVFAATKGITVDQTPWKKKAREMRASGEKIGDIATALGLSRASVGAACRGIKSEAKPSRKAASVKAPGVQKEKAAWRDEAKTMRLSGMKISEIAFSLGLHIDTVRKACRGVACPVDHRAASAHANRPNASIGRKPSPPLSKTSIPKPAPPSEAELARREGMRRLRLSLQADRQYRTVSPITLPRLSILVD